MARRLPSSRTGLARKDKQVATLDTDLEGLLGQLSESEIKPGRTLRIQARVLCDGCKDPISQEPADKLAVAVPVE